MRNICFISPKFYGYIGGMETHAFEFANFFSKNRKYALKSIITRKIADDGILSKNINLDWEINRLVRPVLMGNFKKDAETILQNSNPLKEIYYLNSPTWLPAAVIIKRKYPDVKIIVRSGGNDLAAGWIGSEKNLSKNMKASRLYLVYLINNFVDKLIVNSDYSLNRSLAMGVNPDKIMKILGGVDCDKFQPIKNKKNSKIVRIVLVSRLVKFKGIEYSLKAIKELIYKHGINLNYTIVGDGPEKKHLINLSRKLKIEKKVNFLGAVNLNNVSKILSRKDIFLHLPVYLEKHERGSSYIHTETMGRSICEASACGLPVVSSRVGGVPEVILEGKTGLLVKERDYREAAKNITLLLREHKIREAMMINARSRALNVFSFKKIFKIYERIFDEKND